MSSATKEPLASVVDYVKLQMCRAFRTHGKNWFWKEEDLHSYLYHLLLSTGVFDTEEKTLVHREYPIMMSLDLTENHNWAGLVDIAVIERRNGPFDLAEERISEAIELKFPREWKTGLTCASPSKIARDIRNDVDKLSSAGRNLSKSARRHLMIFELVKKPYVNSWEDLLSVLEEFGIEIHGISLSYLEVRLDGSVFPQTDNCNMPASMQSALQSQT